MKRLCCCLLAVLLLCCSCGASQIREGAFSYPAGWWSGILGNKLIYANGEPDFVFNSYDLSTGENHEIGRIKNFQVSSGDVAIVGDSLYIFACLQEEEAINHFYKINLKEGGCEEVYSEQSSGFLIATQVSGKYIYAAKQRPGESNGQAYSFIEQYDTRTGERKTILEMEVDEINNTGKAFSRFYLSEGIFYLVTTLQTSDGSLLQQIETYRENGEYIAAYEFPKEEQFTRFGVWTIRPLGNNYLYIKTLSDYGMIAKIEEGRIVPVTEYCQYLEIASCIDGSSEQVFFDPYNEKNLQVWNSKKEALEKYTLPFVSSEESLGKMVYGNGIIAATVVVLGDNPTGQKPRMEVFRLKSLMEQNS